jgi:hypothetical protein
MAGIGERQGLGENRLEVQVWEARPIYRGPVKTRRRHGWRFPPSVLGITGTLFLHLFVLQSVGALGVTAHQRRPPESQDPASRSLDPDATLQQSLVLIQPIASPPATNNLVDEFAARDALLLNVSMPIARSVPTPPVPQLRFDPADDPTASAAMTAGDPTGRAKLFGIYSGQIHARIERIWRRPRTPVSANDDESRRGVKRDETFRCEVAIVQDPEGQVEEVLLPRCNGTAEWQRSLVLAIQHAAPLPPPPDPTFFRQTLTLDFVGLSYTPNSSAEGYEVASASFAQAGNL